MIRLSEKRYLQIMICVIPALNLLSGINIDLLSPSLPAIADHYGIVQALSKNLISVALIGFGIGSFIFGELLHRYDRKKVILISMGLYIVASILCAFSVNIDLLLILRFMQGLTVTGAAIGAKTLAFDEFKGKQQAIALLYTSIAYGLGPIIGPYFGGVFQHYIGWQANFFAYAVVAFILWTLLKLFLLPKVQCYTKSSPASQSILVNYASLLRHPRFVLGILQLTCMQVIILIYPTIGPFFVEKKMHVTPVVFGISALIVGSAYLSGSLINRVLLRFLSVDNIIHIGKLLLVVGLLIQFLMAAYGSLTFLSLLLPIFVMCFSLGFIFSNTMTLGLRVMPELSSIAAALQIGIAMILVSFCMFIISKVAIVGLMSIFEIFIVVVGIQVLLFLISRYGVSLVKSC